MYFLKIIHRGLRALGDSIAGLISIIIAIALFFLPALGALYLCYLGAALLGHMTRGGLWVTIPATPALVALGIFYVWKPHVGPAIWRGVKGLISR